MVVDVVVISVDPRIGAVGSGRLTLRAEEIDVKDSFTDD
jgi:hypothetical protein